MVFYHTNYYPGSILSNHSEGLVLLTVIQNSNFHACIEIVSRENVTIVLDFGQT